MTIDSRFILEGQRHDGEWEVIRRALWLTCRLLSKTAKNRARYVAFRMRDEDGVLHQL